MTEGLLQCGYSICLLYRGDVNLILNNKCRFKGVFHKINFVLNNHGHSTIKDNQKICINLCLTGYKIYVQDDTTKF